MSAMLAGSPKSIVGWELPLLSDNNWDQPEYYETIRFGDFDGDGQAELIARGPAGIVAYHFDKNLGEWRPQYFDAGVPASQFNPDSQWLAMPAGPPWSDQGNWDLPQYYQTIRLGDIDGDGQAELIARSAQGIVAFKFYPQGLDGGAPGWYAMASAFSPCPDESSSYNNPNNNPDGTAWDTSPSYYDTIRLVVLNTSDTGPGGQPVAYLVARGKNGIQVWRWTGSPVGWTLVAPPPADPPDNALSDSNNWNQPQYYRTFRYRDVDGDGLTELLARGGYGIWAFAWTPEATPGLGSFQQINSGSSPLPFPDSDNGNPANNPDETEWQTASYYYGTIRLADIDGDGLPELLGRGKDGLQAWQITVADGQIAYALLTDPNSNPDYAGLFSDQLGWAAVEYANTFRFGLVAAADDGPAGQPREYLVVRGDNGVDTWRWTPTGIGSLTGSWEQLGSNIPPWADSGLTGNPGTPGANADWENAQYYNTIQLADVDGDGTVELLGRNTVMVETWKWLPPAGGGPPAWARTNAPFPSAAAGSPQAQYYQFISQQLSGTNDLRSQYDLRNNATLAQWYDVIQAWRIKPPQITPPINPADPAWQATLLQLQYEVGWAQVVFALLNPTNGLLAGWLNENQIAGTGWLNLTNCHLAVPPQTPSGPVTIVQALTSALWAASAIFPVPDGQHAMLSVATGLMSSGAVLLNLADPSVGDPTPVVYSELAADLALGFGQHINQLAVLKTAAMGDYGLLRIIGGLTTWSDTAIAQMSAAAAQGLRTWCWQSLAPAAWAVYALPGPTPPGKYPGGPGQYYAPGYLGGGEAGVGWIYLVGHDYSTYPQENDLSAAFNNQPDSCVAWVNGLDLSINDAINALDGWMLPGSPPWGPGGSGELESPSPLIRLDLEARVQASGDRLQVALTLINRGFVDLSNVAITAVRASGPLGPLVFHVPQDHHRVARGRRVTELLTFPAGLAADPERLPHLEVEGRFAGGTFTSSVPITSSR